MGDPYLPPEILDRVMFYLDNADYLSCYHASSYFHVASKKEHRRRIYENSNLLEALCQGDLDKVCYHLDNDSIVLFGMSTDARLHSAVRGIADNDEMIQAIVAYNGHRHILNELIRRGKKLSRKLAVFAARGGQLDFLKYLTFIGFKGSGIVHTLNHYFFEEGLCWHKAMFGSIEGINLEEFYEFSQGNELGMDIKGTVFTW